MRSTQCIYVKYGDVWAIPLGYIDVHVFGTGSSIPAWIEVLQSVVSCIRS
ncbi:hypothetical protein AXF42_Ash007071 [Apostasia shenzhenica]|uniref:Uncharacterized protein n=1 Tax=Apostasia shenzhenica TaxID=1088818 RepID=A0A2I0BF19_9ASPA|nr:hypothetical protein AXF42_Ash007071 [Apostasia shenzhenica]